MKRASILSTFSLVFILTLNGQDKKELDKKAIKDMCGCYDITFKYTETFAPEVDYEKRLDYTAGAIELALPIVDQEDKISIQHLLVINDTTVIKHWRQDWEFENQKVFYYDKDNNWVFQTLPMDEVKGQWTQKVFQVDDSPRYSGSATWVHTDGKHYWENKASSPLPRREYTKRKDYNVMFRGNRQEITKYGWLHEQDNDKIVRKDGKEDVLLVQEKGFNVYTKVADDKCKVAMDWWKEHNGFWADVRTSWDELYDREGNLTLAKKVEGKPLFMHLYPLEKMNADSSEISELLSKFVVTKKMNSDVEGK
ncbi:DUF6607 family protein [uncultured Croceitalea sp.]|uniref:DUF6607 family protein n=1 Tax=uncultured Croceitalea sp. TaxID=1798908 RepID=UPI003305D750